MLIPGALLAMFVGSELGVVVTKYQPMKIAASEAQWQTCQPCSFSLFQIGGGNRDETPTKVIQIPHLLSLLATNSWNGQVQGLNEVNAQYQQQYGPNDYVPNVFVQYWSMRGMAYTAGLLFLLALWGGWLLRRKRILDVALVQPAGGLGRPAAVRDEHGGLDADRERAPALDRAGADAHLGRGVRVGRHRDGGDQHRHVRLLYLILGVVAWTLMVRYARRPLGPAEPDAEPASAGRRSPPTDKEPAMDFALVWFTLVTLLWTGFFVLEGFDFGVGMLHGLVGRTDAERRLAISSIGPLWDGNEVWLIVAGASMFAAFPGWYATMFSGFYLALILLLVALIVRGVVVRVPRPAGLDRAGGGTGPSCSPPAACSRRC